MLVAWQGSKLFVDRGEILLLGLGGISSVNQITKLNDKVWPGRLEFAGRFCELRERFPVVPCSSRRLIGIVQVGDQADSYATLRLRGTQAGERARNARPQEQKRAIA